MRHTAIYNTHQNVVSIDDGLGAFDENGNSVTIDETKVAEEEKRLQAEYDANQYKRDRQQEYPSLQECIHAILDNDLETLQAKRTAVKTKYPKPT